MIEEPHGARRPIVYCIVPAALAAALHEPLRRHFAGDPRIEVVVERRAAERRSGAPDRRAGATSLEVGERRSVRAPGGRRVAERRAPSVELSVDDLPRAARAHARRLRFVQRLEEPSLHAEDLDSRRLVIAFQRGDRGAFTELYMRYFDRVYNYMRVALNDEHEAEEGTQQVFVNVLGALPRYRVEGQPFRAWLFTITRNQAITLLRRQGRLQPSDPAWIDSRRRDAADDAPAAEDALRWVSDRELVMLIQRLPLPQRQALVLRYMLDLSHEQIAEILDRSTDDVRQLLHRARRFLRERLTALGRRAEGGRPQRMLRRPGHAFILRNRRFALLR